MSSIRWRLFAAVGLVVGVALGGVALYTARMTETRFHEYREVSERAIDLTFPEETLDAMRAHYDRQGSWAGIEGYLRGLDEAALPFEVMLLDADDNVVAITDEQVRLSTLQRRDDGSVVYRIDTGNERSQAEILVGAEALLDDDGELIGSLVLLPTEGMGSERAPAAFVSSVRRGLLLGVVVASALALATVWWVSRQLLGPIATLEGAARALGAGRLGTRTGIRSNDELGELAKAFDRMAADLERAESFRRRFVGDVAHELRSPLTNVRCQVEAWQDGLTAIDADSIAVLHEEVMRLNRLVDDLQQLTIAESGALRLDIGPVRVAEQFAAAALAHQAYPPPLTVLADADLPEAAADPHRFRQVLDNLIRNARQAAGPQGRIELHAEQQGDAIVVRVADNGPGIPADELERIFERFHRTDPSRTRATGGAGLGLAIARELVERQRGRIWAANGAASGAVVQFTLPVWKESS